MGRTDEYMSAIGQFTAGMGTQTNRNVMLEPWRENTRSESGAKRNGEIAADGVFIAGGGVMGLQAGRLLAKKPAGLGLTGVAIGVGIAAVGAVGVIGAATGVKNLFAKLPSSPPPAPNPTDPKPPTGEKPPTDPGQKPPTDPGQKPPTTPTPPSADPGQKTPSMFHTVRPGETLNFIADCNDVAWRDLYTYNRDTIGPNPDDLDVGTRLAIPPKDFHGEQFAYVPTRPPGHLPDGLECVPSDVGPHADC